MSTNATSREESTDTEHVDARLVLHDLSMDHTALNELPDFEPYCAAVEFATDALETAINRDNDYWLIAMRINTTDTTSGVQISTIMWLNCWMRTPALGRSTPHVFSPER